MCLSASARIATPGARILRSKLLLPPPIWQQVHVAPRTLTFSRPGTSGAFQTKRSQLSAEDTAAVVASEEVDSQTQEESTPRRREIGALQRVPAIAQPNELLACAVRRSTRIMHSAAIKNEAERARNKAARQMDTLMKELSVPLTRYLAAFPSPDRLHPFERSLLELTVGERAYMSTLDKVNNLRKSMQEMGKGLAHRAASAPSKRSAIAVAEEGLESLPRVFTKGSKCMDDLKVVAKKLRQLPYVVPTNPTLALVGAPNVGKSSLVRILSSGTPEVCNYPFTTRSIKMGHFYIRGRKHQVTDTPGLLQREDEYRNAMERLTLAALQHLPTSVLFVMDLTEECGTSLQDQWAIRADIRQRFPDKLWLDVFTKADLVPGIFWEADEELRGRQGELQPEPATVSGPVDMAAALPGALRVSSLTEQGLDTLKLAVMELLQSVPAPGAETMASPGEDSPESTTSEPTTQLPMN